VHHPREREHRQATSNQASDHRLISFSKPLCFDGTSMRTDR